MRLHRVKLTHYRGVVGSEVTFAENGVTIVEGQNEVGKTSLLEAVDLIVDYPDSSNAAAVKSVRPVDRDEGPEVEIDVSTGAYRFVYRKRWQRDRVTQLTVLEPAREQLTGRDAHDRVREMLDETLDGALWAALKLEQGGELRQAAFGAGVSLGLALDHAAGGDASGGLEDDLWSRVLEERARYWTATGQPKGSRATLREELEGARARVADLESELRGLDTDAEAVALLVEQAGDLEQRARDSEKEAADLKEREETIARYRTDVRQAELEHEAEAARHDLCVGAATRRAELIDRVVRLGTEAEEADESHARALPLRRDAEERHDELHARLEQARTALAEAEAAHRQAAADETFRRQQIELAQLSERHDRILDAQVRLTEAEAVLDAAVVDDELLARIEDANLDRVKAQAAAASGAVSLDATALADAAITVDGSPQALSEGETTGLVVTDSVEIVIGDLVRLDVRAGSGAQELAERLTGSEAALADLCTRAGVTDVDGAQKANQARNDAERTRAEASRTIQQDLRDLTLESLAQKIARLGERTDAYHAERLPEPPIPASFEAAKALTAEQESAMVEARETVARCDDATREAAVAVAEAEVGDAALTEKARHARSALQLAQQELDAARANRTDEASDADRAEADARLRTVTTTLSEAKKLLEAQDPDSVEVLLGNAVATRRRTADELGDNREETQRLRTRLDIKGEEGLASDLDEAKTALAHLEREFRRIEERAAAVALLHEVMSDHRARARNRYVAPFREGIEQLGRIVFGESLHVELDDDLRITRRTLDGVTVDFDELSTGAQEQLGLIGRLACAAIVSADGGAPVVFDDALGWTDPTRLDRMGAAIALAGRDCQIIVLTCTPGRYANVGNARVVQLPA